MLKLKLAICRPVSKGLCFLIAVLEECAKRTTLCEHCGRSTWYGEPCVRINEEDRHDVRS